MTPKIQPLRKKLFLISVIENNQTNDPTKIKNLEEVLKETIQGIRFGTERTWVRVSQVKELPEKPA
jgi:hypothetical protein